MQGKKCTTGRPSVCSPSTSIRPPVGVQPQHQYQAAGLILAQKAAGAPADDDHRLVLLVRLHVDAGAVARVVADVDLAAPHGVARRIAGAAVDDDAPGVHGVAYGVLGVAVDGDGAAAQICAQRVAGYAVNDQRLAAHAGGNEPLPLTGADAALLPGAAYGFVQLGEGKLPRFYEVHIVPLLSWLFHAYFV